MERVVEGLPVLDFDALDDLLIVGVAELDVDCDAADVAEGGAGDDVAVRALADTITHATSKTTMAREKENPVGGANTGGRGWSVRTRPHRWAGCPANLPAPPTEPTPLDATHLTPPSTGTVTMTTTRVEVYRQARKTRGPRTGHARSTVKTDSPRRLSSVSGR